VLDNTEDLNQDRIFLQFVARLVNECANLTVLLTSRKFIELSEGCLEAPALLKLMPLKSEQSVELFITNSASTELSAQEIFDTLILDQNYPAHKLFTNSKIENWPEITLE